MNGRPATPEEGLFGRVTAAEIRSFTPSTLRVLIYQRYLIYAPADGRPLLQRLTDDLKMSRRTLERALHALHRGKAIELRRGPRGEFQVVWIEPRWATGRTPPAQSQADDVPKSAVAKSATAVSPTATSASRTATAASPCATSVTPCRDDSVAASAEREEDPRIREGNKERGESELLASSKGPRSGPNREIEKSRSGSRGTPKPTSLGTMPIASALVAVLAKALGKPEAGACTDIITELIGAGATPAKIAALLASEPPERHSYPFAWKRQAELALGLKSHGDSTLRLLEWDPGWRPETWPYRDESPMAYIERTGVSVAKARAALAKAKSMDSWDVRSAQSSSSPRCVDSPSNAPGSAPPTIAAKPTNPPAPGVGPRDPNSPLRPTAWVPADDALACNVRAEVLRPRHTGGPLFPSDSGAGPAP